MEKLQAKNLINDTFNKEFSKEQYGNFIINLLDGINVKEKQFTCGNALVPDAFKAHINSYGRLGKYKDPNNKEIEVLWVNLKKETALDRARTMQRNFIAWYLNGGRGGIKRKNALVAFYNSELEDWRFSFVKIDTDLEETKDGDIRIKDKFTAAKRFSFLVGEQEPNHTAQKRLLDVLQKDRPTLADIEESFNIEKVSKEFFATYKALFLELVDDLKEIRKNDTRINTEFTLKSVNEANFCKKLMGQLVFLYFIQKKGWLGVERYKEWGNGNKKFLREIFNKSVAEGKNFFNDYLEPLFYNALANGERDNDWFELLECKIPFLNGGLFEPICDYNWVDTDVVIPNEVFSNNKRTKDDDEGTGILDVFDRYNFTVKEDEPLEKEVAVDPEMLGKVFEELLEVQDRKSKGAFYTPREIVHYMCQESLINYLSTELEAKVPKEDIAEFIHHGDEAIQQEAIAKAKNEKIQSGELKSTSAEYLLTDSIRKFAEDIDKALANIKICDPAIGSGAFPVGMMNEIIRARLTLLEAGLIKQTKNTNAYEYKRQAIQNSIYGVDIDSGAIEIAKLRLWLSLVVDEDNMDKIKPLPNLDYKIVCGNSLLSVAKNLFNQSLFQKLEELKPQFFGETRKREKRRLKKEIDEIISELTRDGSFDFKIHFSEVFHEKGGFNVVIGNPPYVQLQKDGGFLAKLYQNCNYVTFKNTADIYCLFYEKGHELLNNHGVLCLITSNKWMRASYGDYLRKFLKEKTNILEILDLGGNIFAAATVDTNILITSKLSNDKNSIIKTGNNIKDFTYMNQEDLDINCYTLSSSSMLQLKKKIESLSKPLKKYNVQINYGIKTGFNDAFIIDKVIKEQLCIKDSRNEEIIKSMFKGRDIQRWKNNWDNLWLINTHNGYKNVKPINTQTEYPVIFDYLSKYEEKLEKRSDKGNHWSNLRNCAYLEDFKKEKIVWAETIKIYSNGTRNYPRFTLISDFCYLDKTVFMMTSDKNKFFLAILNSKLSEYLLDNYYSNILGSGSRGLPKSLIQEFPVVSTSKENENTLECFVSKILDITKSEDYLQDQEKQTQVKKYEEQIDLMVYKLYELDYSEVLTIEPDFKMSEEEYNNYSLPVKEAV